VLRDGCKRKVRARSFIWLAIFPTTIARI